MRDNSAEFKLGLWEGAYPEEKIQEIAELYELTNQQPFGELEIEDMHMTPEQLRQLEKNIFARETNGGLSTSLILPPASLPVTRRRCGTPIARNC